MEHEKPARRSPRERYREQARTEAKLVAWDQLAASGVIGVSVNAIAKRMGITGPALYRYFESRDALLGELAADANEELAEAVESARLRNARKAPAARFRAMAGELRDWALGQPHRYRLVMSASSARNGDLMDHCVRPFSEVLGEVDPHRPRRGRSALDRQLAAWHGSPHPAPAVLRRGLLAWTRLHGLISLEVEGRFDDADIAPDLLFRLEVENLLTEPW